MNTTDFRPFLAWLAFAATGCAAVMIEHWMNH